MIAFLLDSVIVIDHFNGVEAATRFLRDHREDNHHLALVTRNTKDFDPERDRRHYPSPAAIARRLRRASFRNALWPPPSP
jgi:hypothetical protein